jgi:hypothetical protein
VTLARAVRRVRWSIRLRLLCANLAGGLAVMTILFLSSGRLAPDLPVVLEVVYWFVPMIVLFALAYAWGTGPSAGRSGGRSRSGRRPRPSATRCCASRGARPMGRSCSG